MSKNSQRNSESHQSLNVPLLEKLSSVFKSASSFIDTRLLLHDKGVLAAADVHSQLQNEIESSMSLICKFYSKIIHNQEKYCNTVDQYKLPSSLSSGVSSKKNLRFQDASNIIAEEEKKGGGSSTSSSNSSSHKDSGINHHVQSDNQLKPIKKLIEGIKEVAVKINPSLDSEKEDPISTLVGVVKEHNVIIKNLSLMTGDKVIRDIKVKIEYNQDRLEDCIMYLKKTLVSSLELRELCFHLYAKVNPENMYEDGVFIKRDYLAIIEKAKSFAPQAIKNLEMNPEYFYEPQSSEFENISISAKAQVIDNAEFLYYGQVSLNKQKAPLGKGIKFIKKGFSVEQGYFSDHMNLRRRIIWHNKNLHTGQFTADEASGFGVHNWQEEREKYSGFWKPGKLHVYGALTYSDGDQQRGVWLKEQLVDEDEQEDGKQSMKKRSGNKRPRHQ